MTKEEKDFALEVYNAKRRLRRAEMVSVDIACSYLGVKISPEEKEMFVKEHIARLDDMSPWKAGASIFGMLLPLFIEIGVAFNKTII